MAESVLEPNPHTPTNSSSSSSSNSTVSGSSGSREPWNCMVSAMAMNAVIQKHANTPTTLPVSAKTVIKSIKLAPLGGNGSEQQAQLQQQQQQQLQHQTSIIQSPCTASPMQGYIAVNSLSAATQAQGTSPMMTVPVLGQSLAAAAGGTTQFIHGTSISLPHAQLAGPMQGQLQGQDMGQASIMHLQPVGYTPTGSQPTMEGTQILQSGFW